MNRKAMHGLTASQVLNNSHFTFSYWFVHRPHDYSCSSLHFFHLGYQRVYDGSGDLQRAVPDQHQRSQMADSILLRLDGGRTLPRHGMDSFQYSKEMRKVEPGTRIAERTGRRLIFVCHAPLWSFSNHSRATFFVHEYWPLTRYSIVNRKKNKHLS